MIFHINFSILRTWCQMSLGYWDKAVMRQTYRWDVMVEQQLMLRHEDALLLSDGQ